MLNFIMFHYNYIMFKIPSLPDFADNIKKDDSIQEFSLNDVEKWEMLGAGSFGTTFLGKFKGKEVALKQLHASQNEVPKFYISGLLFSHRKLQIPQIIISP